MTAIPSLKLMHVDDDADIREIAGFALELDPALEVTSFPAGQAALDRLAAGMRPDVILLDVMMPALDGPGVLEKLRRIDGLEQTPVIFMTARAQSSEVERLKALGAIGVIVKPFDPMDLARQVRGLLAARRA